MIDFIYIHTVFAKSKFKIYHCFILNTLIDII
jgi:hypothetical protein